MRLVTAALFITTLLLVVAIVGLACGGGEEAQAPTSEATRTATPPSPTPEPTPTPTAQEVEDTLGHYENTELGFAFDYPDHWEQLSLGPYTTELGETEDVASIAVGTVSRDASLLNGAHVGVSRLLEAIPEDEFFENLDNTSVNLAGQAGGILEEKDWTELAGLRARRYVFDFAIQGVPLTSEQVITVQGDLQFTLDCQGERARFHEVRAGCHVVLDSFEFTSGQGAGGGASEPAIDVSVTDFTENVKAGTVESVEVDAEGNLWYELIDDGQTFKTTMEEGDTIRQILEDAGIAVEDFPPIKIRE